MLVARLHHPIFKTISTLGTITAVLIPFVNSGKKLEVFLLEQASITDEGSNSPSYKGSSRKAKEEEFIAWLIIVGEKVVCFQNTLVNTETKRFCKCVSGVGSG